MSSLEISTALSIAASIVRSNIKRTLSKLGAKDRIQATIIALKRGLPACSACLMNLSSTGT